MVRATDPLLSAEEILARADDLPCADLGLLSPLKRSSAYRSLRSRLADVRPVDAWQANMIHYFAFEMRPNDESTFTVIAMRWEDDEPVQVVEMTG